jgi:hypothetical protein
MCIRDRAIYSDTADTWLYGGEVRNISFYGNNAAGYGIYARSVGEWTFDNIAAGYVLYAGIRIDSGNGVLAKFNVIDRYHFVYGSTATTENAYGLQLAGSTTAGNTQNLIKSISGLVKNGYMVLLDDNVDNNHFWRVHASASGTGGAVYMLDGDVHHPRNNLFLYVVGKVYIQANCKGNQIITYNSEGSGLTLGAGGHLHYDVIDYVDYGLWGTPRFALFDHLGIGANDLALINGSATLGNTATQWPVINMPDAASSKAGCCKVPPLKWNAGAITGIRIYYTFDVAATDKVAVAKMRLHTAGSGVAAATPEWYANYNLPVDGSAYLIQHYDIAIDPEVAFVRGDMVMASIERLGSDAADTFTDVLKILGLRLTYYGTGPDSSGSGSFSRITLPE